MKEKNCIDCKNLKAKIPIKKAVVTSKTTFYIKPRIYQSVKPKTKNGLFESLILDYKNATVSCSAGMILCGNLDEEIQDKTYKNVLKLGKNYKNNTFKIAAKACQFFESGDGSVQVE